MQHAYTKLWLKRRWIEFRDVVKVIETKSHAKAFTSIKDVLRLIVLYQRPCPSKQLLTPSLWVRSEEAMLSKETADALELTFSSRPLQAISPK